MIILIDGPNLPADLITEKSPYPVFHVSSFWSSRRPGEFLQFLSGQADSPKVLVGGWRSSNLSFGHKTYWEYYAGRAVRSVGFFASLERGWSEASDFEVPPTAAGISDLFDWAQGQLPKVPRPLSFRKFVGNRAAQTIFLGPAKSEQPFGLPGAFAKFSKAPDFLELGYASLEAPQYIFRGATEVIAVTRECYDHARLYAVGPTVHYDNKLEVLQGES